MQPGFEYVLDPVLHVGFEHQHQRPGHKNHRAAAAQARVAILDQVLVRVQAFPPDEVTVLVRLTTRPTH